MNENFDLEREINFVVKEMCSGILSARKREKVAEEIKAHFEDSIYQKNMRGISSEKAFQLTYEEFCNCNNSNIKQLLAITHNSLSTQTIKNILYYLARISIAIFFCLVFRGLIVPNGGTFYWYYYVPFVIIAIGFLPLKYFKESLSRFLFYIKLERHCKTHSFELTLMNGFYFLLFKSANVCDFIIKSKDKCYVIKFFGSPMLKGSLCFLDEVFYVVSSSHSGGAGFVDQRQGRGNLMKLPDLSYTTSALHTYSFYVPSELINGDKVEKILLISPTPKEISYVRGNSIETLDIGKNGINFYMHSKGSFLEYIA